MSSRLDWIKNGGELNKEFIVNLKGKNYPTWPGILSAASQAGLVSLRVDLVQAPTTENNMLAIVRAVAKFDDDSEFADLGDCSPASTSPQLAAAAIRLASTRAKGRVLRDALNIGQTLAEELPGDDEAGPAGTQSPQEPRQKGGNDPQGKPHPNAPVCSFPDCGVILSQKELQESMQKARRKLCATHLAAVEAAT